MKRFWLFGGCTYYAEGGLHDFKETFATVGEAVEFATALPEQGAHPMASSIEWWHVWDAQEMVIVKHSRYQAHDAGGFGGRPVLDDARMPAQRAPQDPWPILDRPGKEK